MRYLLLTFPWLVLLWAPSRLEAQRQDFVTRSFDTWSELVAEAAAEPPARRTLLGETCGTPGDSVAVVFPLPSGASFLVHGQRTGGPVSPDTIMATVIGVQCHTVARTHGLSLVRMDAAGIPIDYYAALPLPAGSRVSVIRTPRNGHLLTTIWDGEALRDSVFVDSVRAAEVARAQAEEQARRQAEAAEARRRAAEAAARRQAAEAERERTIRARGWPQRFTEAALARQVMIGMTPAMVRAAWGEPRRINETLTATGSHQQWVYSSGAYIYVDDGVVTTIQTSR